MNRFEQRWQERWQEERQDVPPVSDLPPRPVRLEESASIRCSAEDVWTLIHDPHQAPTLSPATVSRAFVVPGTPEGAGQQHCFISPDGSVSILEVVEHVAPLRAVLQPLAPPAATPTRMTYDLTSLGDRCRLTLAVEVGVPAGAALEPAAAQAWHRQAQDYLVRVQRALETTPEPDSWAVSLDDAFIAAAPVREQTGAARAAAARRISADHSRREAWRAPAPPPRRPPAPRSLLRRLSRIVVVLALSAVAVLAADEVFHLRPPGAVAVPLPDGTPRVPRPADARDTRLAQPLAPPVGHGGYEVLAEHRGRPVGFDPCRPVHWVMRGAGAPPDALPLLSEGFTRLGEATGLVLVHDGLTDEAYDERRPLVQPERYGNRYAPVLVAWSDEREIGRLEGDVGGFAGPRSADPDGAGPRYVSGLVVLDGPQLQALPEGREARLGVLLHELGHLAGLGHVADRSDSMYESSGPANRYTSGALRGLAAVGNGPCFPD